MNKPLLGMTLASGFALIAGYRSWNPNPESQRNAESTPEVIHQEQEITQNIKPALLHPPEAIQTPAKTKNKNQRRAEQAQVRREKLLTRELAKHGMSFDEYPFAYVYLDLVNGDPAQSAELIVASTRTLAQSDLEWPKANFEDSGDYRYNENLRQSEMRILRKIPHSPEMAVAEMKDAIYDADAKYAARIWTAHLQESVDANNHPDPLVYEKALKTVPELYIRSLITETIRPDSDPALSSITYTVALSEDHHIKYPMLVELFRLPHTDPAIRHAIKSHLHTKFGLDLSDPEEVAMIDWDHFFDPLK